MQGRSTEAGRERSVRKLHDLYCTKARHSACIWDSLMAQMAKNLPATRETWVRSLSPIPGWGRFPWRRAVATHSSILAWRIPMDRESWQVTAHRLTESDMTEGLSPALHKLAFKHHGFKNLHFPTYPCNIY